MMRDFFDILKNNGLYFEELHLRSTHEYFINGNRIEFISSINQQNKGKKRSVVYQRSKRVNI